MRVRSRAGRCPARAGSALRALLAFLLALACDAGPPRPAPAVVVISVDTLRVDRIGAYGASRVTPRLDLFARESVLFERAYTSASHTLPAHVTLFTGLHGESHGVFDMGDALSSGVPTLAATLREHGFRTAAFVNGGYMDPVFGLGRGFEVYDFVHARAPRPRDGGKALGRDAPETNADVRAWLRDVRGEPFFLFVHYFDAHSDWQELPYEAPPEYLERFAADPPPDYRPGGDRAWASRHLLRLNETGELPPERHRDHIARLYDAGVAYADAAVGDLLELLRSEGLRESALVVLLSDHGEEFGEHGLMLHEQVYEELVRIPLLLALPGKEGRELAGRRVARTVHLVDVFPTILDWLSLRFDPVEGASLLPLLREEEGARGPAPIAFFRNQTGSQHGASDGRWKLVVRSSPHRVELFDLAADAGELDDVAAAHPEERRRLETALEAWIQQSRARSGGRSRSIELDPDQREGLEALGYGR